MRPIEKLFLVLFFSLLILNVPPSLADEEQLDTELVQSTIERERRTSELAQVSDEKSKLGKISRVTFENVMADPDNLELNFTYAKTQVADGNFLGAAATLERILMINENAHPVRLLYAMVLIRLDSLVEAQRELDTLSALELPDKIREDVKSYKKEIRKRQKVLSFTIRQSNGFGVDENKNAAPSSKVRLVANTPIPTSGGTVQRKDTSFINVTSLDATYDLGFQAGHELFGNFTYFRQDQTTLDSLDLGALQYELGARLKTPWFDYIPSFTSSHVFLSHESFLRTHGGKMRIEKQLGARTQLFGVFKGERQNHLPVTENLTAPQRSGPEYTYKIGGSYALLDWMLVGTELEYQNKNAKEEFNAHEKLTWKLSNTILPGKGQFIVNSLDTIFDFYDEVDTAVAGRHRRDKALRYRLTYGVPLKTLFLGHDLPSVFGGVTLSLTYEYYRQLSTITNNTYSNNKFQGILSKSWNF